MPITESYELLLVFVMKTKEKVPSEIALQKRRKIKLQMGNSKQREANTSSLYVALIASAKITA